MISRPLLVMVVSVEVWCSKEMSGSVFWWDVGWLLVFAITAVVEIRRMVVMSKRVAFFTIWFVDVFIFFPPYLLFLWMNIYLFYYLNISVYILLYKNKNNHANPSNNS